MADGKSSEAWDHTSWIVAQQATIHRDIKKRKAPFMPYEFHPYKRPRKPKGTGKRIPFVEQLTRQILLYHEARTKRGD